MTNASRRSQPPTVLVVDDSPVDRKLSEGILAQQNVKTIFASDGAEALQVIEAQRPDVVLTDLQMPVMDGLALVGEVRNRFSSTPIILMTGQGSEEIAAEALRTGAASYVPKRNLRRDLASVLATVLAAIENRREREHVLSFVQHNEIRYQLGYEPGAPKAVVNHLQEILEQMKICDEIGRLRVGTALVEALTNAIDHGNLELDSKLREDDGNAYRQMARERSAQDPWRERRVHVRASFTTEEARFVIRDEGSGFDPSNLPDPTDPENLLKPSGRGVMLIRTFMDDVSYNDRGNEITLVKRRANA